MLQRFYHPTKRVSSQCSVLGHVGQSAAVVSCGVATVYLFLRQGQRHPVHGLRRSPPRQGTFDENSLCHPRLFAVNSSQAVLAGLNGEVSTECLDRARSYIWGACGLRIRNQERSNKFCILSRATTNAELLNWCWNLELQSRSEKSIANGSFADGFACFCKHP